MARNEVRLKSGQRWSAQDFVDHYKEPTASGTPTPVAGPPQPVDVDMSWYMGEGPGRYYHPGMFPIIHQIIDNRSMAPGVYELEKLASDANSLKAGMSHYGLDVKSADYPQRALVLGAKAQGFLDKLSSTRMDPRLSKKLKSSRSIPILTLSTIQGIHFWKVLAKSVVETTILKTMVVDMKSSIVGAEVSMHRSPIAE